MHLKTKQGKATWGKDLMGTWKWKKRDSAFRRAPWNQCFRKSFKKWSKSRSDHVVKSGSKSRSNPGPPRWSRSRSDPFPIHFIFVFVQPQKYHIGLTSPICCGNVRLTKLYLHLQEKMTQYYFIWYFLKSLKLYLLFKVFE